MFFLQGGFIRINLSNTPAQVTKCGSKYVVIINLYKPGGINSQAEDPPIIKFKI